MKLNIFPKTLGKKDTFAFHPYFKNLYNDPPENIEFVQEYVDKQNTDGYEQFIKAFKQKCLENDISEEQINKFIESRDIELSNKMKNGIPVWVAVLPMYIGSNDWMIEIEDCWSLFFPFSGNAENADYDLTMSNWVVRILKVFFEMDNCKLIMTHMKDTVNMIETVFGKKVLSKTVFLQQSAKIPENELKVEIKTTDHMRFLFQGGSVHTPEHFFLRGGLETLVGFANAYEKNQNIHLTIIYDMSVLPDTLVSMLRSHPGITYVPKWQTDEQMAQHQVNNDVFIIPAFRIHCMSTLMSMVRGNPIICSDGWGFDEYVYHNYTGLVAKGQTCSWKDKNGLFRESYKLGRGLLQKELMLNVEQSILKISSDLNFFNTLRMNCVNEYIKNYQNDTRNQVLLNVINRIYA